MDDWRERISINPKVMLGKPCIKGTRVPVEHILEKMAAGVPEETIASDYRNMTVEDVRAAAAYARDLVGCEDLMVLK